MSTPASSLKRLAALPTSAGPPLEGVVGMSTLTTARSRPRTTALAKGIMSSTVHSSTSSWPRTFRPRLSPTDSRSTPARSQIRVI